MLYVLTCAFVDYFSRLLPLVPRLKDIHFDSLHGKMVQVELTEKQVVLGVTDQPLAPFPTHL